VFAYQKLDDLVGRRAAMTKSTFERWSDAALERHLDRHPSYFSSDASRVLRKRYVERCNRMTEAELKAAMTGSNKRLAEVARFTTDRKEQDRICNLSDDELWNELGSPQATQFHAAQWRSREANKQRRAKRTETKAIQQLHQQQLDAAREQFRHMTIDQLMAWQPPEHATAIECIAASDELFSRSRAIERRSKQLRSQGVIHSQHGVDTMRDITPTTPRRIVSARPSGTLGGMCEKC
jgi:hypothetical protein